jgi:hypothetical protein
MPPTILVVDDDAGVRSSLVEALTDAGLKRPATACWPSSRSLGRCRI